MLSLLAGLSAGHKAGIAIVASLFVLFAVSAALVIPSRWPDFPGRNGLRPFLAATVALFVAMVLAVIFLARESKSEAKAPPAGKVGEAVHVAQVTEVDYKIKLPAPGGERGGYTFEVRNAGKDVHNLKVTGPGIAGKGTPTIKPGRSASFAVDLKPGTYELYCSIPGHKQLGMDVHFKVT